MSERLFASFTIIPGCGSFQPRNAESNSPAFISIAVLSGGILSVSSSAKAFSIADSLNQADIVLPARPATIRSIPASSEDTERESIARFVLFSGKWA